ncbi:hypothetical protein B0H17DRAFT_1201209 [Mycena rosella]|uniref:Uncharacterized protein n=1 Tax=Mycena rosella TaxID=1033263 RepID=A0AAD7GJV5_MYCRO|nr:hypothetical protein B0H17DRAFT_1201209 [Mycena rosella]
MALVYTANATTRPVISTAAPGALYELLSKQNLSHSSALARKTIEHQLKSYDTYISAPRKALVLPDSSQEQIPQTAQLEGPPKKRQKAEPRAEELVKDVDEWIITHEKYLADGERLGDDWHSGLITFADSDAVFPSSTKTHAARSLVRPTNLPGYEVLSSARAPTIDIQPSTAAFKRTFDRLSDGLLKGLDWSNVLVTGGIVLGALLALDGVPDAAKQWATSDIDVYMYGLAPAAANAKLKHLFETFRANLPAGAPAIVVRNSKTVTFYSRYPLRRVQVVLKLVRSPKAVLLNFDLDVCAMGWDGTEFWMLPRAARALETGFSVFTMNLIQGHYLSERRASQEQR